MKSIPTWVPRAAVAVALVALVAWSFNARWEILSDSPFPLGVDGYYYPIQLRALLDHGALQYPAAPVAFWLMAPLAAVTDPIVGAKLGAALGGALLALPAYAVGRRLGRVAERRSEGVDHRGEGVDHRGRRVDHPGGRVDHPGGGRVAGLVAAALATPSAGSAYLTIEFVKNGIGLTLALVAIALALRAIDGATLPLQSLDAIPRAMNRRTRPWSIGAIVAAIVGFAAAFGTHKMAAGLALAVIVPAVIAALRGRRIVVAIAVVVAVAAVTAIGVVAPGRFVSAADLSLVEHAFDSHAEWRAPALVQPNFTIAFGDEALVGELLGLIAVIALVRRHRARTGESPSDRTGARGDESPSDRTAAWVIAGLAIAIGFPWLAVDDPQGLTFRLRAAAFVPMALAGAIVAGAMIPWMADGLRVSISRAIASRNKARRDSHVISRIVARALAGLLAPVEWAVPGLHTVDKPDNAVVDKPDNAAVDKPDNALEQAADLVARTLLVVAAVVLALRVPGDRREGEIVAHPTLVASALAVRAHVPAGDTAIIPERHIAFMVAWYAQIDVSLRPEPIAHGRRWRMIPRRFFDDSPLADNVSTPLDLALTAARREPTLRPPIDLHARVPDGIILVPEDTWDWIVKHLPPDEQARVTRWPTR